MTTTLSSCFFPKVVALRSKSRVGFAALGAACLVGTTGAPAHAQTDKPDIQWQRGIFDSLGSFTWAGNGQVYAANGGRSFTVDLAGHTRTIGYLDVYRASDLTYTQGIAAFSGGYGGYVSDVSSTGYPGHIVIAAVGADGNVDPAHPNTAYGWGPEVYSPHLRLYRENLTLLADIDLGTLPGSSFADYYYRGYDMRVVFSADGNRLAISTRGSGQGGPFQTLLFDTSQRESGTVAFLKALPGVNPVFPTVDTPFTDYGIANFTDYLYLQIGSSEYHTQLNAYKLDGTPDSILYYDSYNFSGGVANMGVGRSLGFTGYKGAGPFFINGTKLSNGSSKGSYFDSTLTFSPLPASNLNGYRFGGYSDMVTRLIRWNGIVAPNERLFLSGNVSEQNGAQTGYGFVQVYDMDNVNVITRVLSTMQVQTDPSRRTSLSGFTPSYDSNNLLLKYLGYTYDSGSTYGNYLQVKGIHNEVITPPELGGTIGATALSPDGTTLAVLHVSSHIVDLYRTGDAGKVASISFPSDAQLSPNRVQFSQNGQYVAVFYYDSYGGLGSYAPSVLIYRVSDTALVSRLDLPFGVIALSPDFSLVAAALASTSTLNQGISVFRTSDGALVTRFAQNRYPFAFSPDGSALVSTMGAYSAQLRDIQTGQSRWIGGSGYTTGFAFSPDGVMVAQYDGTKINLLSASNGALKQSITITISHDYFSTNIMSNFGFLPNGVVFAATTDNKIKAWDSLTGTQLRNYVPSGIVAPTNGLNNLSLAPNGQYFTYVSDSCLVNVAKAPYAGQDVRIGAGGLAVAERINGSVTVTVSVRNYGADPADVLTLTGASLGPASTPTTSVLPLASGPLAAGDTRTFRLTFPASALNGITNGLAGLRLRGSFISGTFDLGQRATIR